jgi:hypothetical protein
MKTIKQHRNIIEMNGEELAEWLHNTYESIAREKGWETQKETQVKFKDLPQANKSVMLGLAECILINLAVYTLKKEAESVI